MSIESQVRGSPSPYVDKVWRGRTTVAGTMTAVASSQWELVFWNDAGICYAAVRGPETHASTAAVPPGSESIGIRFSHGAAMPHLPPTRIVDAEVLCGRTTTRSFRLGGREWETPTFDNAEDFVDRLIRAGALVRDPLVGDVVWGGVARVGVRSVQRRVMATTGLTQAAIRQIERARAAAVLLQAGRRPLEVVHDLDFYDQPHLARALHRFIGRTATELMTPSGTAAGNLSLLYKPEPPSLDRWRALQGAGSARGHRAAAGSRHLRGVRRGMARV